MQKIDKVKRMEPEKWNHQAVKATSHNQKEHKAYNYYHEANLEIN